MKLITLFITNFSFYKFLTDYFARSNFEATRQNFNNILSDFERIGFPYSFSITYNIISITVAIFSSIIIFISVEKSFNSNEFKSIINNFVKLFFINTTVLFGFLYLFRAYNLSRAILIFSILLYPLLFTGIMFLLKRDSSSTIGRYAFLFLIPLSLSILFFGNGDSAEVEVVVNEEETDIIESSLPVGVLYEDENDCASWLGSPNFVECRKGSSFSVLQNFSERTSNLLFNDGKLYILKSEGEIYTLDLDTNQKELFLDLKEKVFYDPENYFESGLFGIAFEPNENFFLTTYSGLDNSLVVEKYPKITDEFEPEVILNIPSNDCCHYSGNIIWSDYFQDFLLSIGDMGNGFNSNDTTSYKGKVILLEKAFTNGEIPLISDTNKTAPLNNIVAFGLRNPWKTSIYKNFLFVPDIGFNTTEEVNVVDLDQSSGPSFFGWPIYEGDIKNTSFTYFPLYFWDNETPVNLDEYATLNSSKPQVFYSHNGSEVYRAALIGGDVVSDSNGKYYEHYIFADYLSKELFVYDFKNDELFQFPLPLEFDSYITALIVHPEDPNKTLVTTGQGDLIEITIP